MERIENRFLEREMLCNYYSNMIFKNQRESDLNVAVHNLKILNRDIVLEINSDDIVSFPKSDIVSTFCDEAKEIYWNNVIALLFLTQLRDNYWTAPYSDIDREINILNALSEQDIIKYRDRLLGKEDVLETFDKVRVLNPRMQIVVRGIENEDIWRELYNYLNSDLSHITMIYTDKEVPKGIEDEEVLKKIKNCTIFDKDDSGITLRYHRDVKGLRHEKKIQKNLCRNNK